MAARAGEPRTVRGDEPQTANSWKKTQTLWVPKHVSKIGNIFCTQDKNPLQLHAQPSENKLGSIFATQKKAQRCKILQKRKCNGFPRRSPKMVPKIATTTRTLVHCYLKTKYACEGHQHRCAKWEPFFVPKTGTHYNPMRSRVRRKR